MKQVAYRRPRACFPRAGGSRQQAVPKMGAAGTPPWSCDLEILWAGPRFEGVLPPAHGLSLRFCLTGLAAPARHRCLLHDGLSSLSSADRCLASLGFSLTGHSFWCCCPVGGLLISVYM